MHEEHRPQQGRHGPRDDGGVELVGCIFGNANPRYDIPRLLSLYMDGKLKLDEMVTEEYTLDEVNQGYQDLRDGKNIRGLIRFD